MKKRIDVLLLIIFVSILSEVTAQEPFNIPMIDRLEKQKKIDFDQQVTFKMSPKLKNSDDPVELYSPQNLTPVSQYNLTGSTGFKQGQFLPGGNLSFIQYRLGLYENDDYRIYLPLVLLSKVSTNYDTLNFTTLTDITSFQGAPITFRIMPNYDMKVGKTNTFTVGATADFRGMFFKDSITKEISAAGGFYANVGLKYAGNGQVRDEAGINFDGKWSLSMLGYVFVPFKSKFSNHDEIISSLFEGDENSKTKNFTAGLEWMLKFNVLDSKITRFNIYVSARYMLVKPKYENPYSLTVSIGN